MCALIQNILRERNIVRDGGEVISWGSIDWKKLSFITLRETSLSHGQNPTKKRR